MWELLGQVLEIQLLNSNKLAGARLGIPLLTAGCGQPLPLPKALQNGLDPGSKAIFPCP